MSKALDLSVGRAVTIVAAWITSVKCSESKRSAFRADGWQRLLRARIE